MFRFDDRMLVGHDSPLLHLRRLQEDGMFGRFASRAEALWEEARPVSD